MSGSRLEPDVTTCEFEVPALERVRRLPLAEIRRMLDAAEAAARAPSWVAVLRADGRRGAAELADRLGRRRELAQRDSDRVERLFDGRRRLFARGLRHVAGVDEVGVGPLAGPVVAAAVVLPERVELPGLDDSKKLGATARERLSAAIHEQALGVAIAEVSPAEIDRMNVRRASLEAMRRAVESLVSQIEVEHVMVDAHRIPSITIPQTPLIHGDALDGSIAAASIVAKVHRDALMQRLEDEHPGYGFAHHMGYGTAEHLAALQLLGASPIHRRSFAPVAAVVGA